MFGLSDEVYDDTAAETVDWDLALAQMEGEMEKDAIERESRKASGRGRL